MAIVMSSFFLLNPLLSRVSDALFYRSVVQPETVVTFGKDTARIITPTTDARTAYRELVGFSETKLNLLLHNFGIVNIVPKRAIPPDRLDELRDRLARQTRRL